jgi:hypothetical protein
MIADLQRPVVCHGSAVLDPRARPRNKMRTRTEIARCSHPCLAHCSKAGRHARRYPKLAANRALPLTTQTARLTIGPETSSIAVDDVRHSAACQMDPVFEETSPASHRFCISRPRVPSACERCARGTLACSRAR